MDKNTTHPAMEYLKKARGLSTPESFVEMLGALISEDEAIAKVFAGMMAQMIGQPAPPIEISVSKEALEKAVQQRLERVQQPHDLVKPEKCIATFGEVEIPARDLVWVHGRVPEDVKLFRGEKIVTNSPKETGILMMVVGARIQRPVGDDTAGTSSIFFAENSLGSGVKFDTWEDGVPFVFLVRNNSDAPVKWSARVYGNGCRAKAEATK